MGTSTSFLLANSKYVEVTSTNESQIPHNTDGEKVFAHSSIKMKHQIEEFSEWEFHPLKFDNMA